MTRATLRWVLASASPARLAVLRAAGASPEVIVSGIDESNQTGTASEVALKLAMAKATAVAESIGAVDSDTVVFGCDSVLEFQGEAWGKPATDDIATKRWRMIRGKKGVLHTGHCAVALAPNANSRTASRLASTVVHFADVTDLEIAAYVATGEPLQVAGGFTIDGMGAWFIERLEGDHSTVIGISLPTVRALLIELGLPHPLTQFSTGVDTVGPLD